MTNREWEQFGEEIRRTVQDAVDSRNYEKLNQTISNTINQAVNTVAWNVRNFSDAMNQKRGSYQYQQPNRPKYEPIPKEMLYAPQGSAKAGSVMLMVFGYLFGIIGLILLLICGMVALSIGGFGVRVGILTGISTLMVVGFGTMALIGTRKAGQSNRFKKYLRALEAREFCNLAEIEAKVGKSHQYIVKDLEKMIKKGWFRQGHLDHQKTCLIVTDHMYEQYCQLEIQKQTFEEEENRRRWEAKKEQEERLKKLSPEVQKVIAEGDAFIQKLRACNDAIPGEEISAKISHMEVVVDKIFERVEQNPESVDDIRKLMEYYLPTTIKLLEAYEEMDDQPIGGDNIHTAKAEIEATLDTLNIAFEKLLDSLFQSAAWDVSSDISVLNTMLAQEGLNDSGFKNN